MSTETTNKKIKIDNGTTFGRTYTDKAVDELLKNIGGGGSGFNIFDNAFSIGVAENINEETLTLTEVGLNKINSMFTNGKLLGLCFEDPANITTDFTFIPFVSLTDGNYWFTGTTYITGTNLQFTQIKINKTTGAIEMVQKLIAATDVE